MRIFYLLKYIQIIEVTVPHAPVIRDGVGEMGETKWTFHKTLFFRKVEATVVGRVRGTEGQAASGPAKPTLQASSGHATGVDALRVA